MNFKTLSYVSIIFFFSSFFIFGSKEEKESSTIVQEVGCRKIYPEANSLRMYDAIMKYSEMYNIPKRFAFGVAYIETRYEGPFHWAYNHKQTSCVGALGPMQIMPSTGKLMWKGKSFTNEELKNNIEFNVQTSMKLLRNLHDKYGDWKIVFGCYNTGRPMVNDYAIRVYNHQINWRLK